MPPDNPLGKSTVAPGKPSMAKPVSGYKWKVIDTESAVAMLKDKSLLDEDGIIDCEAIAIWLFKLADDKATGANSGEVMRAISFSIRHMAVVDAKQADTVEVTKKLARAVEEMRERNEERMNELQQAMEDMKANTPPCQSPSTTQHSDFGKGSSYATMLRSAPMAASVAYDPVHNHAMQRMEMKERRVIITGEEQGAKGRMAGLSEVELLAKAKLAVEQIDEEVAKTKPKNFEFKSVNKMMGGSASYELDSSESAAWLRRAEVKKRFVEKFGGGTAGMRELAYPILARYVPTSLGKELEEAARHLEDKNEMKEGDILRVKWMKDPKFWDKDQKYAFLVVVARSKEVANRILEKGLKVEGRAVEAQILDEDPRRCFRCQAYTSHLATECPVPSPACGICGKQHDTKACDSKNQFRCINCVKAGILNANHPTFSRACPCFIEEKRKIAERRPEHGYKFYPTADPAT